MPQTNVKNKHKRYQRTVQHQTNIDGLTGINPYNLPNVFERNTLIIGTNGKNNTISTQPPSLLNISRLRRQQRTAHLRNIVCDNQHIWNHRTCTWHCIVRGRPILWQTSNPHLSTNQIHTRLIFFWQQNISATLVVHFCPNKRDQHLWLFCSRVFRLIYVVAKCISLRHGHCCRTKQSNVARGPLW